MTEDGVAKFQKACKSNNSNFGYSFPSFLICQLQHTLLWCIFGHGTCACFHENLSFCQVFIPTLCKFIQQTLITKPLRLCSYSRIAWKKLLTQIFFVEFTNKRNYYKKRNSCINGFVAKLIRNINVVTLHLYSFYSHQFGRFEVQVHHCSLLLKHTQFITEKPWSMRSQCKCEGNSFF